jgi:hypothetical protein
LNAEWFDLGETKETSVSDDNRGESDPDYHPNDKYALVKQVKAPQLS